MISFKLDSFKIYGTIATLITFRSVLNSDEDPIVSRAERRENFVHEHVYVH